MPRTLVLLVVLACLAHAASGSAQGAETRTLAVQLYDEGDRLMQQGQYEAACVKLGESHRLDPQLGALLYLAECYEKSGRLASAWGAYREGEEIALRRGDDRAPIAGERARALEPRLSRMVLELPPGERPDGYEILREGVPIARALWDTAIAVDAGHHRLEVSAPGHLSWTSDVAIEGEGARVVVRIPALERAPEPEPVPAPVPTAVTVEPVTNVGGSQRIAAIAVGGLGIVGLGIGGYFALVAQGSFNDSEPLCNDAGQCTERGVELRDDADDAALIATVASSVGGAALVGAAILWFTAPDATPRAHANARRLAIAPTRDGIRVALGGTF